MSIAATQLRHYLEGKYPGIRISRYACRDTAGGSVSQHSAFDGVPDDQGIVDSNALDVMGAARDLDLSYTETQEWLDVVYEDVMSHAFDWSIRLALWRVPDHYGHIHWDLWPTCTTRRWCADPAVTPMWESSTGAYTVTIRPDPENGEYHGPTTEGTDVDYIAWANGMFDLIDDDEITALFQAGFIRGDPDEYHDYYVMLRDLGSEGRSLSQRAEVARFIQTSTVSAWLNTDRT